MILKEVTKMGLINFLLGKPSKETLRERRLELEERKQTLRERKHELKTSESINGKSKRRY
jgi:hypothetical protein